MPKNCPVCGLVSPDNALTCDCGYSFQYAGTVGRMQLSAAGRRNKLIRMLSFVGGIVGTLFSLFVMDFSRGVVYCAVAAIIGLGMFLRGSSQVSVTRREPSQTSGTD